MSAPLALPGVDFAPRADADSDDQHTPPWLVAEVDAFLGGIDTDPAWSSESCVLAALTSLLVAFFVYAWLWLADSARCILGGRLPSLPYFSRPMPMIPSITGGVDHSVKATMQGRKRGGPQAFTGAWHAVARCSPPAYLPRSVVVITPGFAEVRTASGATHLVHDGSWVAKRRASAMARAASLTFGRPRTRGAVKA